MFTITQKNFTTYVLHQFFNGNIFIGQVVACPYKKRDFVVTHVDLSSHCFNQALLQLSEEYKKRGKDLYGDNFPLIRKP